jgi:hypothetical protein
LTQPEDTDRAEALNRTDDGVERKPELHAAPSPLWFLLLLGVVVLLAMLAK